MRKKEKLILRYSATEEELKEVFNYWEIAFIFAVFVVVLYLLYPKGMLKRQVLQEQSNYELTAIYLQNMLRLEPDNIKLILATAKVLLKEKKLDLAEELIGVLKKSRGGEDLKKRVLHLEFELLKIKLYETDSKSKKEQLKKEMLRVLKGISKSGAFDKSDAKRWYQEAIALKDKRDALVFLKPLDDIDSLEKCVYISAELNKTKKEIECLEKLIVKEKEFPKKWILALYSLYIEQKEYKKAYKIAKDLADTEPLFQSEPARTLLLAKDYKSASKEYMKLYQKELEPQKKINYLFRAISALSQGGFKSEAVSLAKSYQDRYLEDDKIIEKFIKFYLSISDLDSARELAQKSLHLELAK